MCDVGHANGCDAAQAASSCRALTVVRQSVPVGRDERPLAGFVTQLIACKRRLPPFRRAGRAEPAIALGLYGSDRAIATREVDLVV